MRSLLIRLGKQSVVYGLSGAVIQAIGLVTLPVYTRAFTSAEYGVVEIATVAFSALIVAVDAGLGFAMQRGYFAVPEEDEGARRSITSTATLGSTALAAIVAVPTIIWRASIAEALFHDRKWAGVVMLVALAVPAGTLATFLRDILRLHFRPGHYAVSAALASGVGAAVGVVWVLAFDGGVIAVAAGLLAGQVASAAYGWAIVRGDVGPRFSWPQARALLRVGAPLLPAGAALWGIGFVDRVMLSQLDGLSSTGQYAVGTRFASVLLFFTGALATAYTPFLFSLHREDPKRERVLRGRLFTYAAALFVGIALALSLFAREITTVVAPGYDRSYHVVAILCLGVAAYGLVPIAGAGISITGHTGYAARYTTMVLAGNVVLCLALIPWLGLVGAALASAAGYVGLGALYLRRSQRLDTAEFRAWRAVRAFALGAVLMPIGLLDLRPPLAEVGVKLAALALFAAGLWVLRVLGDEEREELRRTVARVLHRPAVAG